MNRPPFCVGQVHVYRWFNQLCSFLWLVLCRFELSSYILPPPTFLFLQQHHPTYPGRSFRSQEPVGSLPEPTGTSRILYVPSCSLQPDSGRFFDGQIPTNFLTVPTGMPRNRPEFVRRKTGRNPVARNMKEHKGSGRFRPCKNDLGMPTYLFAFSLMFFIVFTVSLCFFYFQLISPVPAYFTYTQHQFTIYSRSRASTLG